MTEHRLSGMGHTSEWVGTRIDWLGTGRYNNATTTCDSTARVMTDGRIWIDVELSGIGLHDGIRSSSYNRSLMLLQIRDRLTAWRNYIGTAERSC